MFARKALLTTRRNLQRKPCRRWSFFFPFILLSIISTSCGNQAGTTESGVPVVKKGKLTVCSDTSYEPYEFARDGDVIGFDIDLSKEIAKDLKVEADIFTTSFEGIQSGVALNSNQCDIALSGTTITEERRTKMDFSASYAEDDLGLLVPKTSDIKNLEGTSGKAVGVQVGTTGENYAKSHAPDADIQQFETTGDMMTALKSNRLDSVLGSANVLNWVSKDDDDVVIVQEYETGETLGASVKKNNARMLEAINKTIDRIKRDGQYQLMVKKWLTR